MLRLRAVLSGAVAAAAGAGASRADTRPTIRVARIQGVNFLPMQVMQRRKLLEKHAARLGILDGIAEWFDFPGDGNATDAMLAGNIAVVNASPGNLLLLWDPTKGGVKGTVNNASLPAALVTREPRTRRITGYRPQDRIAVPTMPVSTPVILIQMACKTDIPGSPTCTAVMFGMTSYARRQTGMVFETKPQATLKFACFLHRTNRLRTRPESGTGCFIPEAAGLGGT